MKISSKAKADSTRYRRLWIIAVLGLVNMPVLAFETRAEIDWARQVELSTPVKGVIQNIMAQAGQHVAENEILLQLDQRGFISQVKGLKAQVAHYKADLDEAKREQDRAMELYDRTVLSDHELQVAKNNFIAAQAKYQNGRAKLVQAELDLEYSSIRAPFDAVIISRQAEVGQTVVPDLQAVTLFIVADAQHMLAKGQLTAKEIAQISIGQEAVVKFAGKQYKGRIINFGLASSTEANNSENRYFVNVEFPIKSQASHIGQSATIDLP